MRHINNSLVICFALIFFLVSISQADIEKPVILQLQWLPQAQFAGYIMAYEKGLFKREGLDVRIKFGGPGISPLECVVNGEVDFCTAWLSQALTLKADDYFDGDAATLILKDALETLPEKQRQVFVLRYYDELSYNDISELLETSVGGLKASYHHAVKKIEVFVKSRV